MEMEEADDSSSGSSVPQLDTTTFNPSSVAQHYSHQIGHVTAPGNSVRSRDSTGSSDVFNLARHYRYQAGASPTRSKKPNSSLALGQGFFPQGDQFDVDQSVNFMDHNRGNYTPPPAKKIASTRGSKRTSFVDILLSTSTRDSKRTSFVDILLSRRGSSSERNIRSGTPQDTIHEEKEGGWPVTGIAYFLVFLGFVAGATFLVLSVPHLARSGTLSAEEQKTRLNSIRASLVASGLTEQNDFQNQSSSQHYALQWLSMTDPARLEADDPKLPNRYALAVFFYSNHPEIAAAHSQGKRRVVPEWKNQDNWMTKADTCDWFGVKCEVVDVNGNYKDIVQWNMTANDLQGSIPSEIRALSNLVILDLSDNQLSGSIPDFLYGFPALEHLILKSNALTGTISEEIGYFYPAEGIDLSQNQLRGTIPKTINTAVNLRNLALADNDLKGTIPDMSRLTSLTSIKLDQNKLVGKFPSSLTTLPGLSHISMEGNSLSGSLPSTLNALKELETLSLGHNRFNGGIPDIFESLQNLTEIRLQKNLLQHKLPASLGGIRNLKRIMMDSNSLVGTIPPEWMALTKLEALVVHANELTGSLSSNVGYLVHVKDLWLNKNQMSGELPTELGLLTSLNTLYLHSNFFHGTLPTQIGRLQDLEALRLANNELRGVVPNEVCALKGKDELVFLSTTCSQLRCMCCDKCS